MRRWLIGALVLLPAVTWAADPELPQVYIDTTYNDIDGSPTVVGDGGNFQTAINNASCGDTITLNAGSTYTGNFTLPDKGCSDSTWIYIRTSNYAGLPSPGTRVAPGDASVMAKLTAGSGSILASESGADHYRFIGIEITPSAYLNSLVDLSAGQSNLTTQTNHIVFDRCYIHGHATSGSRRGISAQGAYISVIDSYLSDIKEVGADTQAFAAWNGSGPFKLVNNYLEASTENVMFGGADSASADFIPSDIEIRRNHFYKPVSWWVDAANVGGTYGGTHWSVKNLFELKCARRALIEGNLFEQSWEDGQYHAIVITVRNQESSASWSTVEDITFRGNWIRKAGSGINVLGSDYNATSETESRINITNNLFSDIGDPWSSTPYTWVQFIAPTDDFDLTQNTWVMSATTSLDDTRFAFVDRSGCCPSGKHVSHDFLYNIGQGHISGTGTTRGQPTLDEYYTSPSVTANVLVVSDTGYTYPGGNYEIETVAEIGYENYAGGDYRLDSASDYYGLGPGGSDLGAWIPSAIAAETQLDWSISYIGSGTSVNVTFGYPALGAGTSCTVRAGTNTVASSSGAVERTVQVTGLTPDQQYAIMVDCGAEGGAISYDLYTATEASTGTATVGGAGSNTLAIGGGGSLTLTVSP